MTFKADTKQIEETIALFKSFQGKRMFLQVSEEDLNELQEKGTIYYAASGKADSLKRAFDNAIKDAPERKPDGLLLFFYGKKPDMNELVAIVDIFIEKIDWIFRWGNCTTNEEQYGCIVLMSSRKDKNELQQ